MGESLLANVPFIVTQDTDGGAPQTVCDQTGITCQPTGQGIAEAVWQAIERLDTFTPRAWALNNMCRSKTMPRLVAAVKKLSECSPIPINWQDIEFHGYDWECKHGQVRAAEADFLQQLSVHD
jgi:hypothetical protein